jgi:hypothetical protein
LRIEPAGPDLTAGNQDEKQQVGGLAVPFTISGSFFAPKIAIEQQNLPPVDRTGTGKVRINPLEVEDAWR